LHPPHHPFLQLHWTLPSYGQTCRSCPFLGNALVPVREGTQSRAKADEATMHQKYCLHKRRRIHRPQVSVIGHGILVGKYFAEYCDLLK
jgi:hypothetical protein